MAYTEMNDYNVSGGVYRLFTYVGNEVPIFIPLMLFTLFIVAGMGSYFAEYRFTGRGNFKTSFAVASYFITIVAFFMSLIPNLINTATVVVCFTLSVISTALLFTKDN